MTINCPHCLTVKVKAEDNWYLDGYLWDEMPSDFCVTYSCPQCHARVFLKYELTEITSKEFVRHEKVEEANTTGGDYE